MSVPSVREAIDRVSAAISADPTKARAKNAPATARMGRRSLSGRVHDAAGPGMLA